ncbi:MAG: SHOCT domain-containing protein [Candidatus Dormibacteraeota bacterium]|nr:SHOCT domain-containing protein [Candidatus Dormibacteraeota bacterium]
MMNGWNGMGFLGGLGMLLGTLVAIALVALFFWGWFSRTALDRGGDRPEPLRPLDLLQRRYAAGEISAAEFTQAKQVLGDRPTPDQQGR